jgi:hypothetical protein
MELSSEVAGPEDARSSGPGRAAYGPTLALAVTLSIACFLVLMSAMLLVVHPSALYPQVILQNQKAKTTLYLLAFAVILPVALVGGPRLADTIAASPNGPALPALSALLAGTLAATIILVKLSHHLPWGDGVGVVLAGSGAWSVATVATLGRAARPRPWGALLKLANRGRILSLAATVLAFGALLCVTHVRSLSAVALVLGVIVLIGTLAAQDRIRLSRVTHWRGAAIDVVLVVILLMAIPDVVGYHTSSALPSVIYSPGIVQFQQDWILGPTNQLLGGGALLVNVPVSQYGVGLVYFLAGWFHLAPIGYGTFWILDGVLTALLYAAGYLVLRVAGTTRLLAACALAVAVVAFIYNATYPVGVLPEEGPLRFGVPMALVLALVAAARWPGRAVLARALALIVVGVASIWALEAFAYTAFTFLAMVALEARLRPPGDRLKWLARQAALGAAACLTAHLLLAGATLVATGHLPDWSQYLAYVNGLLLGGKEGVITFGFDRWSAGLVVGAACLASAAAIVLLVLRMPAVAQRERTRLIALCGTTAYAIACLSYTDNRSSTYLFLYISLPVLMAGALWLSLLGSAPEASRSFRLGGLAAALSVVVLMLAAAWPAAGDHFSRSALRAALPGGGLQARLHHLWHEPPIDPRAPAGERLVKRYLPGRQVVVLLPTSWDLAIEILMRSGRSSKLFIGDPSAEVFIPSVWVPKVRQDIAKLRAGERLLTDTSGLLVAAELRGRPANYALDHDIPKVSPQIAWILHGIDTRFRLQPIHRDARGFVVVELRSR